MANRNVPMSEVTNHLKGIDFPKKKREIIDYAQKQNAPREVIDRLRDIPSGEYRSMADLMKAEKPGASMKPGQEQRPSAKAGDQGRGARQPREATASSASQE